MLQAEFLAFVLIESSSFCDDEGERNVGHPLAHQKDSLGRLKQRLQVFGMRLGDSQCITWSLVDHASARNAKPMRSLFSL